eukprot:scaffold79802_cov40-Tisochrysis_lutea.AAC.1
MAVEWASCSAGLASRRGEVVPCAAARTLRLYCGNVAVELVDDSDPVWWDAEGAPVFHRVDLIALVREQVLLRSEVVRLRERQTARGNLV